MALFAFCRKEQFEAAKKRQQGSFNLVEIVRAEDQTSTTTKSPNGALLSVPAAGMLASLLSGLLVFA